MNRITAACICDAGSCKGGNKTNLLFSGQILPETNGGLAGIPVIQAEADSPFTAAVFDGTAGGRDGGWAAYAAARAFRTDNGQLDLGPGLELLLRRIHPEIARHTPGAAAGTAAAALCIRDDRLCLADVGDCRIYLLRGRELFLLSHPVTDPGAYLGRAPGELNPHTAAGQLAPGDRLLLCTTALPAAITELELLKLLHGAAAPADALGQIARRTKAAAPTATITALALFLDQC